MSIKQVVGIVLLMAVQALGQHTPFIATEIHTQDTILKNGQITQHVVTHKRFFFASSGSILIQDIGVNNSPSRAQLLDYGRSGKAYLIDYVDGNAQEQRSLGKQPQLPRSPADVRNSSGEEVLHGFQCLIVPIYQLDGLGGKELIGRAWVAPALNFLPLREDSTTKLKNGNLVHVVVELSDIRVGTEPDSALFATDSESIRRSRTLGW